jgi:subtilisin family serine protease
MAAENVMRAWFHSTRKPASGSRRLNLEALEDRAVPAVIYDLAMVQARPQDFSTKSVLVNFAPSFKPSTAPNAYAQGLQIGRGYKLIPGLYEAKVTGVSVPSVLRSLQASNIIVSAYPDGIIRASAVIPNDPAFSSLHGLNNTGQTGGTPGADINAPEAWEGFTGNGNTIVAVIDTGVDYNHPDLKNNMWVNNGETPNNGIDDDQNGYVDDVYGYDFLNNDADPMDDDGHGTHCAGTIGAVANNGLGVAGVNWRAKIMALKFLGPNGGSDSGAIRAIDYAVQMGAKISNNSWGGGPGTTLLSNAIDRARIAGHIFVAAAGNESNNNDIRPTYPANFNIDNVVSVAAIDHNGAIANFSNRGVQTVDIGAPGVDILSCKPGGGYQYLSGTSMAAPHVTGALSLLLDKYPSLTYRQAIDMLYATATVNPKLRAVVGGGGRYLNLQALLNATPPVPGITSSPSSPGSVTAPVATVAWTATGQPANAATIPDGGGKTFTINYPNPAIVANVEVRVSINHTFVSDLNIKLVSPSNREVTLFNRRGGSSDNLSNTRFSDSAGVSIAAGAAPFTGVFRPESLLAAFRGINALGNWRLVVSDNSPMYSGELLSWSIDVTARTLPAISLRNNTAVSLAAGATISSTIQVTRALSINDINVTLGLNVAQAGDVSIVLKSARGDSVVLFNGLTTVNPALAVGFDDQSNTAIPSVSQPGQQGAPQSRLLPGTFRPASTLSRFNSLSRVAAGTWTLEIKDNRSQGSGPASTLTGWGMSIIALAG